jgi:hypothetical protein
MSVEIIEGVPYINGAPATRSATAALLPGITSEWDCPCCGAQLSIHGFLCLNLCHLTVGDLNAAKRAMSTNLKSIGRADK